MLGGGVVPGSLLLVGGEPGIGKSTMLLQAAASVVLGGGRVLYASSEESPQQIRLRADRLLLLTNDGELAKRLNHPKVGLRELYHITLAKKANPEDLEKMLEGFVLDEGFVKAKEVAFVKNDPHDIGMEIHSNRSRIVRRMWEHLGHKVIKVDRVVYGPLTKKDLPRGHWRHLTKEELNMLRMTT